jgi:hypothetical protein
LQFDNILIADNKKCNINTFILKISRGKDDIWPLNPGSSMGKKIGSGSGMNNPDLIRELRNSFFVKILKFFDADPGSGMEKNRI